MADYTRRTHVVRIYDDSSGEKDKNTYVDVEVLDAIAFRIDRNKEVIFNNPATKAVVYRDDDLGLHCENHASKATRRTHMKKVESKDKTQFCAVEVLDAMAFRDANGHEWILNMPDDNASIYDSTKGTGDAKATRRSHDEKLSPTPGEKDPSDYLLVQRDDIVAFRTIRGKEVIVKMASSDDGSDPGRAKTFITPEGYDPTDENGPEPPDLADTDDPHVYFKFMKDSAGILINDDDKVRMGPWWWIRKITGAEMLYVEVDISRNGFTPGDNYKLTAVSNFGWGIGHNNTTTTEGGTFDPGQGDIEVDLTQKGIDAKDFTPTESAIDSTGSYKDVNSVKMPTDGKTKPHINIKDDLYWTANTKTGTQSTWTVAMWFNLTKIRKKLPKDADVEVVLAAPALYRQGAAKGRKGYYLWITSSNIPVQVTLYTLYHPTNNLSVIGPYPFNSQTFTPLQIPDGADGLSKTGFDLYGSSTLQNEGLPPQLTNGINIFGDYGSYLSWGNGLSALLFTPAISSASDYTTSNPWSAVGFTPQDWPTSNPNGANYGFSTLAGAQQWADALNQILQIGANNQNNAPHLWSGPMDEETARKYGNQAPPGTGSYPPWSTESWGIYSPGAPVWTYSAIEIDYPSQGGPPPTTQTARIGVTGAYINGKTFFDYDANNTPKFTLPNKQGQIDTDNLTQTASTAFGSQAQLITVKIDKDNKVTVTHAVDPNGPTLAQVNKDPGS